MKKLVWSLPVMFLAIYFVIYISLLNIPAVTVYEEKQPSLIPDKYDQKEELLYNFFSRSFVDADGSILTNLKAYEGSGDTLSESVGLFMQYCVLSGKKEQFDREVGYLKENMLTDKYLIRWKTGKTGAQCNCAVDDFRIIQALIEASEKWDMREYSDLAGFLQEGIFNYQVNGRDLYEFYDWDAGKSRHGIPLCYLDLYAMDNISDFNVKWLGVEEESLSLINGGRINEASPFYFKYYDYDTGTYSLDDEYREGKGICLTYTLLTALHLAEVNEEPYTLTQWLKSEVGKGALYAWYDPITLKPVNTIESAAVYALAAAYAERTGERELYSRLTGAMLKFSVQDARSKYHGGFGDLRTGYFHSFDNLTALWAFALDDH